jgi:predicted glycosyltransferase
MKILIDIGHPAHVHFFSRPIKIWQQQLGFKIIVTSRKKDVATDLLDALGVEHHVLSSMNKGSFSSMFFELLKRDIGLYKVVKEELPDILIGIGGIFAAHVGFVTRRPSIVFYDTENAVLSNLITYPFCSLVVVPACYQAWLPSWHLRYPGYHELSYLHPERFKADNSIAVANGIDPKRRNFLVRTVSWHASHDLKERTWSEELLRRLVGYLDKQGHVIISSEGELPPDLKRFMYVGNPALIHHVMGHLSLFIGESATMASECAVMGIPAIYAAQTGRGYTDEQESRYGLVRNLRELSWPIIKEHIDDLLAIPATSWRARRNKLLSDKIDVAPFIADLVSNYPRSRPYYQQKFQNR